MREPSLRDLTGTIRHLDASRARQLVEAFQRPVVYGRTGIAYDADDPVVTGCDENLRLATAASPDGSVDVLGHFQTHLHLHGLLRVPLSVARELARHSGHLHLNHVPAITDAVAAELATHDGGGLSLDNLLRLSGPAAAFLGWHGGELSFKRVRQLSVAAARGLAQHANDLFLNGLVSLSPLVAASLAKHRGDLTLDGLEFLAGSAARHLARHGGKLHLHGLTALSDEVAEAFGQRTGYLCLSKVQQLSRLQVERLAGHVGALLLSKISVDDAVAECLGRHRGSLVVRLPADVPLPWLKSLVMHQGPLEISGLARLDERQAQVLARQSGPRGLRGLSCLFIDTVDRISPAVAAILARHEAGGLSLNSITDITEDVARELVKHPILSLDRLPRVSDQVAAILATHAGVTLSLRGLTEVSPRAIAILKAVPSIELSRCLAVEAGPTRLAGSDQARRPMGDDLVRLITKIACRGNEPHDSGSEPPQ